MKFNVNKIFQIPKPLIGYISQDKIPQNFLLTIFLNYKSKIITSRIVIMISRSCICKHLVAIDLPTYKGLYTP